MKLFNYIFHQTYLLVEYIHVTFKDIQNQRDIRKSIVNENPKPKTPPPKPRGRPKKSTELGIKKFISRANIIRRKSK